MVTYYCNGVNCGNSFITMNATTELGRVDVNAHKNSWISQSRNQASRTDEGSTIILNRSRVQADSKRTTSLFNNEDEDMICTALRNAEANRKPFSRNNLGTKIPTISTVLTLKGISLLDIKEVRSLRLG
jgi:hypothetical protein